MNKNDLQLFITLSTYGLLVVLILPMNVLAFVYGGRNPDIVRNGVKYESPNLWDLEHNSTTGKTMFDRYLRAVNEDINDANLSEKESNAAKLRYFSTINSIMQSYLTVSEMEQRIHFDQSMKVRKDLPKDWKDLEQKLQRIRSFLQSRLDLLRRQNPEKFDEVIFSTKYSDVHCDCNQLFSSLIQSEKKPIDRELPSAKELSNTLAGTNQISQLLGQNCEGQTFLKNYGDGSTCTDPYVDKIVSAGRGGLQGFKNRYHNYEEGTPMEAETLPDGCRISSFDSFGQEALDKTNPATYFFGKGEQALDKPCTLLTFEYRLHEADKMGRPQQLDLLRYRGSEVEGRKIKELSRPKDADQLDRILFHWLEQKKQSGSPKTQPAPTKSGLSNK